jgi:hypothetical protein
MVQSLLLCHSLGWVLFEQIIDEGNGVFGEMRGVFYRCIFHLNITQLTFNIFFMVYFRLM